jgi:DNA polymerase family B
VATAEKRNHVEEFVMIPAELAERVTRQQRRAREREARRPKRNHHGPKVKNSELPFIGWDGEGPQDTGYSLFGSSEGDMICHPFLRTRECLDLILYRESVSPDCIHIWFGSNYDVSMILRELSWSHLNALKHWTQTNWEGYSLEHIPHKWLKITKDGVTAKLYDIQSFFGGSYVTALLDMKVGTDEEILHLQSEKARRSVFLWSEIDSIRDYWRTELRLMPVLADALRRTFLDAGFDVTSWHGPGSLANLAMRRHGVFDAMCETPADVRIAARYAFAGGRFELFRGGYFRERISNADIHSAYPAYARNLPNLACGKWRHGRDFELGKFAVYRIRYRSRFEPMRPYPLFRRLSSGEVVWSHECEGWYWAPEAELVSEDPDAEFLESLVFDEDDSTDRPFAWLDEYYRRRQYLKSIGSPLELTFKLIINSVYGQLAQRTGWDKDKRRAPRSHQLEWAGFITSSCRAAVYRAAKDCGARLISIDTDGIYARGGVGPLELGDHLGAWDVTHYEGAIFWQSGIYSLKGPDGWVKGRTRGIPKGKYTADDLIAAMERSEPLKLRKKVFIGYGLAINGQRDKLNTWEEVPHEIVFGGQGKRYHNTQHWCGKIGCKTEGIHEFIPRTMTFTPGGIPESEPHYLPWLASDPLIEGRKRLADDYQMYDLADLDEDEEWVRDYVS